MHPVIASISARKNRQPPFHDGRNIALVLYGGIMLGVRGAGALKAIEDLGFGKAFDSVYTMSSGFLNGSYFLSGQIADGLKTYSEDFSGKSLINRARLWKVADVDRLVDVIKDKKPLDVTAMLANQTKLYVMMINADKKTQEYLEVHDYSPEEYFNLAQASASLPFVGRGTTKINGVRYRDIFRDRNLPDLMNHVLAGSATDILVLYNYPWQKRYVDKVTGLNRQNRRVFEFCPCPESMSRFETDAGKLRRSGETAYGRTKMIFPT